MKYRSIVAMIGGDAQQLLPAIRLAFQREPPTATDLEQRVSPVSVQREKHSINFPGISANRRANLCRRIRLRPKLESGKFRPGSSCLALATKPLARFPQRLCQD